jgi:hypothetical protein
MNIKTKRQFSIIPFPTLTHLSSLFVVHIQLQTNTHVFIISYAYIQQARLFPDLFWQHTMRVNTRCLVAKPQI